MNTLLTEENKKLLLKRGKSALWHGGSLALMAGLNFLAANLSLFSLPDWAVVLAGVLLAQLTKEINSRATALGGFRNLLK